MSGTYANVGEVGCVRSAPAANETARDWRGIEIWVG
jgi:hypothetical protein